MTVVDGSNNRRIFSIGHSNHSWEAFLDLLLDNSITFVVDVRSSPYSRYTPHFNKGPLSQALPPAGIGYLFLGDRLGGHPEGAEFYDLDGRVLYDRLADSAAFQEGIAQLCRTIAVHRLALLCGEEDPSHCHRRLLIARVLSQSGIETLHIRGDGQVQTEAELMALEAMSQHRQMSLFASEDVRPWKSTQSVSPKKVPKNSLKS
ncbi:DUF488 domain-containing protein [Desulfobacca acetoxidans]|uniref:DUF488 domain-containing protein n=1 Tax=Desulfobacca acetoxidans (strain ATCC 700848 / DSM 11109 / ASRB2) TaxID=880072 RepID=F2NDE1_DESAR|nr:DUF488 domain-containing protein [Desulfobacca acetoxidans]AEB10007.1 hypothetical protein Desac_2178 [Desulfobacca acetoxidans DSM 11109]